MSDEDTLRVVLRAAGRLAAASYDASRPALLVPGPTFHATHDYLSLQPTVVGAALDFLGDVPGDLSHPKNHAAAEAVEAAGRVMADSAMTRVALVRMLERLIAGAQPGTSCFFRDLAHATAVGMMVRGLRALHAPDALDEAEWFLLGSDGARVPVPERAPPMRSSLSGLTHLSGAARVRRACTDDPPGSKIVFTYRGRKPPDYSSAFDWE